jgi:hypothetical protein
VTQQRDPVGGAFSQNAARLQSGSRPRSDRLD